MLALKDRLVSWSYDGAIRFWDRVGNSLPGGDLRAHDGVIKLLALGDQLVSWGWKRQHSLLGLSRQPHGGLPQPGLGSTGCSR